MERGNNFNFFLLILSDGPERTFLAGIPTSILGEVEVVVVAVVVLTLTRA